MLTAKEHLHDGTAIPSQYGARQKPSQAHKKHHNDSTQRSCTITRDAKKEKKNHIKQCDKNKGVSKKYEVRCVSNASFTQQSFFLPPIYNYKAMTTHKNTICATLIVLVVVTVMCFSFPGFQNTLWLAASAARNFHMIKPRSLKHRITGITKTL